MENQSLQGETNTKREVRLKRGLGYTADGEPTDAQIQLQDHIDNEIFRFMGTMCGIYYDATDMEHEDIEWDIDKISRIREVIESVLGLPDVY